MAGLILRDDVDAVRERAPIDQIVGEHVALKPAGPGSLKGLCPFHDERSPSFHVRPQLGRWHCFGCGEGGDVISFVMKLDGLSFTEAVEYLAGRLGMTLRYEDGGGRRGPQASTRQRVLEANQIAAEFFVAQLDSPEAQTGRAFLADRGFDRAAAQQFGVGYAPKSWDALARHLRGRGFTEPELATSGLVSQGQRGVYDRFRGRLIWPIRDVTGETIGFGARRLYDDDQGPKYLNTPETPVYHKSKVLYGIDLARRQIAKERRIVVVEGYTDVMAAHLSGVTTAVATCGTAFGSDHVAIVRRLLGDTDVGGGVQLTGGGSTGGEVIFTFDGDSAGQKAALRAFDADQRFSAQTFVAVGPDGMDPCELRLARGPAAVKALVDGRVPLFEFVIRSALSTFDLTTAEGRVGALASAAPIVASIRDRALRPEYARAVAGWIGVPEDSVRQAVARASSVRPAGPGPAGTGRAGAQAARQRPAGAPRAPMASTDPMIRLERNVLAAVLQYPLLVPTEEFDSLDSTAFTVPIARAVHDAIRSAGGVAAARDLTGSRWLETVIEAAAEPVRPTVDELAVWPLPTGPDQVEHYVRGVVAGLMDAVAVRQLADLRSELQRASAAGDAHRQAELLAAVMDAEQRRRALRSQH